MQLLVLVLMLMMSGRNANIKELKPIFEELGGDGAAEAFKQAEEISAMLSAVQSLAAMPAAGNANADSVDSAPPSDDGGAPEGYPLAPIANIADERITYSLSRYIALGE